MRSENEFSRAIGDAVAELCMRAVANKVYDIVVEASSDLTEDEKKGVFLHIINRFEEALSKMDGGLNVEEK